MLFVKDKNGIYSTASTKAVLYEADRVCSNSLRRGMFINDSTTAQFVLKNRLRNNTSEVFACLFLDASHKILKFQEMFQGSITKAIVFPRLIVKAALDVNAATVIFAHNHPSGESEPSQNDIELTKTLRDILAVIDVTVLDHLVIGDDVFSFADKGYLNSK